MDLTRRSFFGASAAAVAALPAMTEGVTDVDTIFRGGGAVESRIFGDMAPGIIDRGAWLKHVGDYSEGWLKGRTSWQKSHFGRLDLVSTANHVHAYRTGLPSIDCLRSVSGVHKARMENEHFAKVVHNAEEA